MNELTIYNTLTPVEKTELQTIAEEIHFLSKKTAEITFRIGEGLARARDIFRHNKQGGFQEWLTLEFNESSSKAYNYINFYENTKDNPTFHERGKLEGLSQRKLFLLTSPSTPESAVEEVIERKEAGENITESSIKELVKAHKEIERLKELVNDLSAPANYPLIPEIQALLNKGQIMPAKAKALQTVTPEGQAVWFTDYVAKFSLENQLNEERRSAQKANEKALKAIEEKEAAIAKLSEVTNNPETAEIIAKHELQLKQMREEYQMKLHEERKQMAKEASEFQAKMHREKIEKAEKEKALAEKREKEMKDKASAAWRKNDELIRENKKLQSQIEVDKPSNIDNARALKLESELKHLDWTFPDIKAEAELAGGEMHETKKIIIEIINRWSSLLQELDGQEIIEINK